MGWIRAAAIAGSGALFVVVNGQAPTEVVAKFSDPAPKVCWFGPSRTNEVPTRDLFTGGPTLVVPLPKAFSPSSEMFYAYDREANRLAAISYRELMVLDGQYRPEFNKVGFLDLRVPGARGGEKVYLTDSTQTERVYQVPPDGVVRTFGLRDGEVTAVVAGADGGNLLETKFEVSSERASPPPVVVLHPQESSAWWLAAVLVGAAALWWVWTKRPRLRVQSPAT